MCSFAIVLVYMYGIFTCFRSLALHPSVKTLLCSAKCKRKENELLTSESLRINTVFKNPYFCFNVQEKSPLKFQEIYCVQTNIIRV